MSKLSETPFNQLTTGQVQAMITRAVFAGTVRSYLVLVLLALVPVALAVLM
jgi:hypothetical protein